MRSISTLALEDAALALTVVRDAMLHEGKAAVIVIADAHGDAIALLRLDGAPASSVTIGCNKAWTAAREGTTTRAIGTRIRSASDGFDIAYYGDPRYCGWGGGLPVRDVHGAVVGSIAVSGLPEDDDERFAAIGLAVLDARARQSYR